MTRTITSILLLFGALTFAQKTVVERDSVLIGEEVKLSITVEVEPEDLVIFPEQPSFGALEVIESYPIDSIREGDRMKLFKQYGLINFDSGDYWIPQLKILKNDAQLLSDSVLVSVRNVLVDTTKQKMFPIKPTVDIPTRVPADYSWLWWLLLLIPIGIIVFLLSRKREKKSYEETLQPYEWTKYRLRKLDESSMLESREWKAYYTELTYILRRYIDSKVYGHALESTSGQLIQELKRAMDEKGMSVTDKTQARLEEILQKADLMKFASAQGDAISAKEDRQRTGDIIYNIHQVLPPPTEEELMMDARYRRKQELKRRSKRIALGAAGGVLLAIVAAGVWIYTQGINEVKDQVFGNELRELYEKDWYTTTYGLPTVELTTPEVLVRVNSIDLPEVVKEAVALQNSFEYGEWGDALHISLATLNFDKQLPEDIEPSAFTEPLIVSMEQAGATNIVMLDDKVEINGNKGIDLTGSFEFEGDKFDYEILMFARMGGLQIINIAVLQDDTEEAERQFGKLMVERIKQSLKITVPAGMEPKKPKQQQ